MNALLGYEYQDFKFSGAGTSALGFTNDDVPFYNILQNAPAATRAISSFEDPDASLQSFFGRVGFNYDDRFIVSGTIRADGSSRFGTNNKYGYFPSGSVAWNITNEEFLKNSSSIQNLRLRASYGLTGNQAFPAGSAQTQYSYLPNAGGIQLTTWANANLKWETTKQLNIGLDFILAKGRVFGNIDYFNRVTSDVLFSFTAIQPAPGAVIWQNIKDATITNSGLEVS